MIYIDPAPNPSGAYPNPKNQPFPWCIALTDEQAEIFFQYNGFVTITEREEVIEDDFTRTVYDVEPNTEAWEAWKASLPPEVEPEPTAEERLDSIEAAIERGLSL